MIELRNNPIEGSSLKLGLSFRDPLGKYYVPVYVNYTLLALHDDNESWDVVDNLYNVSLTPQSTISLVISNMKVITGTTMRRKLIIKYQAFIDNQYADFVDEVNFTIQPQPTVNYDPQPTPPEPEIYILVTDCSLITGSLVTAPLEPNFKVSFNMPVMVDDIVVKVINNDESEEINCSYSLDMPQTTLTVSTEKSLNVLTHYTLYIDGLKAKVGDYTLKEPFKCNFTTMAADPKIQPEKAVNVDTNGLYIIRPDDNYEAVAKLELNVDVNPPLQAKAVTSNGAVLPDSGYYGLSSVDVNIPSPALQEKEANANGVVTPDSEYYGLSKVTVNVPIEPTKFETVNVPGVTHILPASGYNSMVAVDVNVVPTEEKSVEVTTNGTRTVEASAGQLLKSVEIITNVPQHNMQNTKTVTINNNTNGTPITVNPDSPYDCIKKLEVNVEVAAANVSLYAYTGSNTGLTFYSTKEITASGDYNIIPRNIGNSYVDFAVYAVTKETVITFEYDGSTETLTRDSASDIRR